MRTQSVGIVKKSDPFDAFAVPIFLMRPSMVIVSPFVALSGAVVNVAATNAAFWVTPSVTEVFNERGVASEVAFVSRTIVVEPTVDGAVTLTSTTRVSLAASCSGNVVLNLVFAKVEVMVKFRAKSPVLLSVRLSKLIAWFGVVPTAVLTGVLVHVLSSSTVIFVTALCPVFPTRSVAKRRML